MPAERPGQDAAEQQSERAADGGDDGVDAYRLGPLVGLREQVDNHSEQDCGGRLGAGARTKRSMTSSDLTAGQAAPQRPEGEHDEADEKDAPAPEEVAEQAGEHQQSAEPDQVRVDDPGQG